MSAPAAAKGAIRTYELLLGYACNAKCGFCYNPPLTPEVLAQEISLRRAAGLLTKARADGFDGVWFTGGDPTVHKDLPKLLLLARKLGFGRIQIGTNAVRLADPKYARRLVDSGLNYARVSLHAASAALHDELLVLPGAFDAAVKAIANLRALGAYVGVNFVVTARNYKELPAFFRFCVAELKIRDFDVIFLHHRGMMELNAHSLGVRYSAAAPYLRKAFKLYDELGGRAETPTLINIPPCVAPELEPWIADWSTADTMDSLAQPQDLAINLHEMKSAQRGKAPACARCSLNERCLGFEPEYAKLYGAEDFAPC